MDAFSYSQYGTLVGAFDRNTFVRLWDVESHAHLILGALDRDSFVGFMRYGVTCSFNT
mgnify:CR=1 FL=1